MGDGVAATAAATRNISVETGGRLRYKSSWDELFFDLALVAAFGSLATTLSLQAPLSHHAAHGDDHGDDHGADDHADDHHRRLSGYDYGFDNRRRLSGGAQLAHLSFSQSVFLYCLMTATVVSVRRFTDGHRSQWRRNDLLGSAPRGNRPLGRSGPERPLHAW